MSKKRIIFFGCGFDASALIREIVTHPKVFDDEYRHFGLRHSVIDSFDEFSAESREGKIKEMFMRESQIVH